jgi:hypothetical protein
MCSAQLGMHSSGFARRWHCGASGLPPRIPPWAYRKRTGTIHQTRGERPDTASAAEDPAANIASRNDARLHGERSRGYSRPRSGARARRSAFAYCCGRVSSSRSASWSRRVRPVEAAIDRGHPDRHRRVLGEDHPVTLRLTHNLAAGLRALGEQEQARQVEEWIKSRYRL